jgi:WD40 repeat protein
MASEPDWEVAYPFLPGDNPVRALARALTATANRHGLSWTVELTEAALDREDGLALLADELLVAGPGRPREQLLLLIDQGEELLTRVEPAERARLAALLRCAGATGRVRTVLTLRSEFQDRLLALAGLEVDTFPLRPLAREMLPVVIKEPARLAGLSLGRELVDRLVADTGGGEALPLLAFTLSRLAEGVGCDGSVPAARYEEVGGVHGALARHADAALAAAVVRSGRSAEQVLSILVRLVTLDAAGQPTRRRLDFTELSEPDRTVLAVFVDHRLLTTAGDEDGTWIGVAHEALLTSWPPLAHTITARAVAMEAARSVEQAATEWERAGRPSGYLWERGRIGDVRRILGAADLSAVAQAFLHAGRRRSDRVRIRTIGLVSAAFMLVSAGGVAAVVQREEARRQQRVAVARQLVEQAVVLRDSRPRIALALSIEAYRLAPSLPEVTDNLLSIQARYYAGLLRPDIGPVHGVAFTQNGRLLAAAGHDRAVAVWRLPGRSPARLQTTGPAYTVAFSGDGRLLAASGESGAVEVWEAGTLRRITVLPTGRGAVYGIAFSRDGTMLAAGGAGGDIVVWRPHARWTATRLRVRTGPGASVNSLAFAPDGRTLVSGTSDGLTFWDVRTGQPRHVRTPNISVRAVALSSDGRLVASGGNDGSVRLWDTAGHQLAIAVDHAAAVQGVAFGPDDRTVASAGDDGSVRLWAAGRRALNRFISLLGPTDRVLGVAFSPDGTTLAGAGSDALVGLWNVGGPPDEDLPTIYGNAAFGPGGNAATAGRDHRIRLWQSDGAGGLTLRRTLPALPQPSGPGQQAFGIALSPNGTELAAPVAPRSTTVWNVSTGQPRTVAGHNRYAVRAVAFSPRGDQLASVSARTDGDVDLRLTRTLDTVASASTIHTGPVNAVAVGPMAGRPHGIVLATASDDGYIAVSAVQDVTASDRGPPTPTVLPDYSTAKVNAVAFSGDGRLLAGGSDDGTIRLWHAASRNQWTADPGPATPPGQPRPVVAVAFSPDAAMLAAASVDGTIWLWDLRGGPRLTATLTGPPGTTSVAFQPDGDIRRLLTADQNGTPTVWATYATQVRARLCGSDAKPTLTTDEWKAYLPGDPERVCR